ncbi:CocE/NonD family hydrolase [Luteimonas saliphila]|uniref:CocE/NonD family hydrolase n=1 Tax=Luteimonas saliphila TaxID=2804919 RepID=UPI00192E03A1|nr:CocE/NonD family hydrolase [Luteimonas saliphila]
MAWAAEPTFELDIDATASDGEIASSIAAMAQAMLASRDSGGVETSEEDLAHLRIAAGQDTAVAAVVALMRRLQAEGEAAKAQRWAPYLAYARARSEPAGFDAGYARALRGHLSGLDDLDAQRTAYWFVGDAERAQAELRQRLEPGVGASGIPLAGALELARRQSFVDVYRSAARLAPALVREDEERRYLVDDQVLIRTPQGATLSATVARSRNADGPLPTAMLFTIYTAPEANRATAVEAASRGYAGVVVDARGKRLSEDRIAPYEREADDAHAAIDWISRQPWSDGRVAMYGGSYSGFAAWAATRRMHPALKTIVPYVAAIPGLGLPMENNVFLSANYAWPFYVANNRLLDHETYGQRERWNALTENWFASGRPYREIDDVDGTPNPWLQRWLSHPAYDAYWQAMVPYGDEFARIDIPVLSITGYYDDGQISALQYFKEHHRHRPGAEHYLLIGPYDHFGAQAPVKQRVLRGYAIDPSAQFDTREITFQWLDHVLRGAQRPALVRDKVNYQWMGGDAWRHAPSLAAAATPVAFHLVDSRSGAYRSLSPEAPPAARPLRQTVDFADRTTRGHGYYPSPIVRDAIEVDSGFAFVSEPFERPTSVVGTFSGELKVRIDKRDFDFMVVLYELRPDGSAMQLSYFVGRASHARDMTRRELLVPGEWTRIPFERSRMTARRMEPGNRLLVVVDVLKDAHHQVNHGTGRDVSDESLADATVPLTVEWHPDSVVRVPLRTEDAQ